MSKERELLERSVRIIESLGPDYEAYNLIDKIGELLAQPEQEPVSKCIKIIDEIKEVAIENEWNIDEAMSSAVLDIMKHFNMLNGE